MRNLKKLLKKLETAEKTFSMSDDEMHEKGFIGDPNYYVMAQKYGYLKSVIDECYELVNLMVQHESDAVVIPVKGKVS